MHAIGLWLEPVFGANYPRKLTPRPTVAERTRKEGGVIDVATDLRRVVELRGSAHRGAAVPGWLWGVRIQWPEGLRCPSGVGRRDRRCHPDQPWARVRGASDTTAAHVQWRPRRPYDHPVRSRAHGSAGPIGAAHR